MPDELTSSLQVCLAVPESAAWVQSGESAVIYNLSQSGCCCCYREKKKPNNRLGESGVARNKREAGERKCHQLNGMMWRVAEKGRV